MWEKLKSFLADDVVYFSLLLVLVGVISFGLGQQSVSNETAVNGDVRVEYPPLVAGTVTTKTEQGITVVASKNGTKYHLPDCPGAKQISRQNLISFTSVEQAKAAGYAPAANCSEL